MTSSVASAAFWQEIYSKFSPVAIAVKVMFLVIFVQVHQPSTNSAFDLPSPLFRSLEP